MYSVHFVQMQGGGGRGRDQLNCIHLNAVYLPPPPPPQPPQKVTIQPNHVSSLWRENRPSSCEFFGGRGGEGYVPAAIFFLTVNSLRPVRLGSRDYVIG